MRVCIVAPFQAFPQGQVSTQPARQPGIFEVPGLCHAGCCGRPVGIAIVAFYRNGALFAVKVYRDMVFLE
jgi:hypothetical protein